MEFPQMPSDDGLRHHFVPACNNKYRSHNTVYDTSPTTAITGMVDGRAEACAHITMP
jgi:hypothetical protein